MSIQTVVCAYKQASRFITDHTSHFKTVVATAVIQTTDLVTYLGVGFGLAAAATVAVVVGAAVGIFMNSVQKPEEELEGIMLRISSKLRAIFSHDALKREGISSFICHFG